SVSIESIQRSFFISPPRWVDLLDDRGDPLADADAHRRQTVAGAGTLAQLVDQGCQDARARAAQRVAQGNRAAVDVDFRLVEAQLPNAGQRLHREGFVQLD